MGDMNFYGLDLSVEAPNFNELAKNAILYAKKDLMPKNAQNQANCTSCPVRHNCNKPCPKIEALLPKPRSGGHKKEILLSVDLIDRDFYKDKNGEVVSLQKLRKQGVVKKD